MTTKRFEVILAVGFDLTGIARLPRVLHDAGCRVTLFGPRGLAAGKTRFVDAYVPAPSQLVDMVESLRTHLDETEGRYQWLIIADELLLGEIAKRKAEPWVETWFPVDPRSQSMEFVTSKFAFLAAAASSRLSVPTIRFFSDLAEGKALASAIGYPVVLKTAKGFNGSGVRIAADPSEFEKHYADLYQSGELAVQEYVDGKVGLTEVLFDCGKPVSWFSSYKVASWPHPTAASCIREVMDHPQIEPLVHGVGQLTRFDGLAGIDWVHDPTTDRLYLIEFNPRPTPGYYVGEKVGVSFAQAIQGVLSGNQPSSRGRNGRSKIVHMFPQCVYLAIDRRDPGMLVRSLADAPWTDPMLIAAYARRVLTHYLPSGLRQFARRTLRASNGSGI